MRRHQRGSVTFLVASIVCVALTGCAHAPAPEAPSNTFEERVGALFEPVTAGDSPGVAVMVIRDGEVVFAKGYGYADLERREPVTPQTAFRLASVSMQFTAMAIMILAERGRLSYDDSMVKYLPELARFGDRITIRHLLTHTSGLPDYYDVLEQEAADTMPDTAAAMRFLAGWGEPPLFAAGERFEYSNTGYDMLALVVERVSGERFGQFLEDNIFEPLGMTSTVVRDSTEPAIAHRALGYTRKDGSFELFDWEPLIHIIGSGGVYSSVEDLARWNRALDTDAPVSRSTLKEAWTPVRLTDGEDYPYGFGWRLGDYGGLGRRVWHSGAWVGFSTHIARYPERGVSVIVLANLDEDDFLSEEYAGRIIDILFPTTLINDADGGGRQRRPAGRRRRPDRGRPHRRRRRPRAETRRAGGGRRRAWRWRRASSTATATPTTRSSPTTRPWRR